MPVVTDYALPIKQNDELFRLKLNGILGDTYARISNTVTPANFGSLTGTATVNTATLLAFHDYCIANRIRGYVPRGTYAVNGPISTPSTVASGVLNVFYDDVTIEVDAGSTAFEFLLSVFSTALNSHRVWGRLTLNCSDKVQRGLVISSNSGGTALGATCTIEGVEVNDVYAPSGSNGVAYGAQVLGPFEQYGIRDLSFNRASRHTSLDATGDCKGIRIGGLCTDIVLERIVAKNILNAVQDADGIAVFGGLDGSSLPRGKRATLIDCVTEDCQGRGIKTQCAETVVVRPKFIRQAVVSIPNGHDVDSQYGSMIVDQPYFRYQKNGGTSPLGTSFIPLASQHLYPDDEKVTRVIGGELHTEVAVRNVLYAFLDSDSPTSVFSVDGMKVIPEALATTAISRGLIEFDASIIEAMANKVHFECINTNAPNDNKILTYTGYVSADISARLSFDLRDNTNTLDPATTARAFAPQSGATIVAVDQYRFWNNPGYSSLQEAGWVADVANGALLAGNDFTVDLATSTIINGPTLPASGYGRVVVGNQSLPASDYLPREIIIGDFEKHYGTLTGTWNELGRPIIEGSATYNPGNIAAGAVDPIQTMTVTGAALGNPVTASFSLDLQGVELVAWVSAANTVSYQFVNPAGAAGAVDLGSGTVRVIVHK